MSMLKTVSLVFGLVFISAPALAVSNSAPLTLADAHTAVDEYRALRRACAITVGEQRKICFKELNGSNEQYKQAKKLISEQAREDLSSLHLVTQAY